MRTALRRSIGLPAAAAMVVGTIVGASIFVQPSEVSRAVPSFGGILLVWVVAGALTWFGASVCAELASAFPQTGGVYVFLREMFSPAAGFLWGWAMFWSMHSGIIAAIAMVFARYVGGLVPLGDAGVQAVAVAGIVVLSVINYVGVRPGSAVQTGADDRQGAGDRRAARRAVRIGGVACAGVRRRRADRRSAGSSRRWSPACLRSAAGTWSPTPPRRRAIPERTIPRALMIGTAIVVALLPGAQRGVSDGAAARPRARLDARGGRRGGRRRGRPAPSGDLRSSSSSRRSAR